MWVLNFRHTVPGALLHKEGIILFMDRQCLWSLIWYGVSYAFDMNLSYTEFMGHEVLNKIHCGIAFVGIHMISYMIIPSSNSIYLWIQWENLFFILTELCKLNQGS